MEFEFTLLNGKVPKEDQPKMSALITRLAELLFDVTEMGGNLDDGFIIALEDDEVMSMRSKSVLLGRVMNAVLVDYNIVTKVAEL